MAEHFDPYHRWLGIGAKHQPADHYRLLGLDRFEDDPEVIRDAAERQIAHVRRYALGQHGDDAQRILNELAAAKWCLLDADRKARYDEELRCVEAARAPAPRADPLAADPPPQQFAAAGKQFRPDTEPGAEALRERPVMLSADGQKLGPETRSGRRAARRRLRSAPAQTVKIVLGGLAGLLLGYALLRFGLGIDVLGRGVTRHPRLAATVHERNDLQVPTKPTNLLPSTHQTAALNAAEENASGPAKDARSSRVPAAPGASDGRVANDASAASGRMTDHQKPKAAASEAIQRRELEAELQLLVSDKEAPTEKPFVMQADFEGIYLVDIAKRSERRIDTLGYKSTPIFDPNGQRVAYLSGGKLTIPTEIRVYDLATERIKKYTAPGAHRLFLSWFPDGKLIAYSTKEAIVVLNLQDSGRRSFPVPNAEDLSVSPDGTFIVFWRRQGSDANDADGWILYRLSVSTGETILWGEADDGRGVVGQCYWHPDSEKFLITTFDVDDNNERSNIRYVWLSAELNELGAPESVPVVIMQNRYPWAGEFSSLNR